MLRKFRCSEVILERSRELRHDMTEAELLVWKYLKNRQLAGLKFRRQVGVGRFILDFYCPEKQLAVELDGGHHGSENALVYDAMRTKYLESRGIKVLRFWNSEVMGNVDGVLERIVEIVREMEVITT
ncbi:hypothetical protein AUK40_02140 [Candidatus Wirthbacteria bacterium CG2_30_54_11]|uniref:DUF559 domain-containing protein n=1 Tax=Candidatus Wirthbacteria bacterium CG2_30_54_11 TaxID=1817892 RepID=A0A1J5ILI2_9BACT|nr:MAG: hypothetical protein AUK40_02140 [Candidatus Wirthbacteria bacterium CG2_30_54_11]